MKSYEIKSLIVFVVFSLVGAWLSITYGDAGEYIALLICIPLPIAYYVYNVWKHENKTEK
jgi:hypothetical protein